MLNVENLQFAYGNYQIFSDVSFTVKKGSLCGLFGPNGSGKSTLIKCCLKLLKAGEGSVSVDGKDVSKVSTSAMAKLVSYVPQDHSPPFPFLVNEVVLMGRAPHFGGVFGLSEKDKMIADDAMKQLDIYNLRDKAYTQLSGGQRQLVLIARALAQDAPLIMLDEPTSSLDFKNQLLIWNMLQRVVDSGKTVFACAHDPNHVSWFCDEVIVMNKGRIVINGNPAKVLNRELLAELYGNICAVGDIAGLQMVYPERQE